MPANHDRSDGPPDPPTRSSRLRHTVLPLSFLGGLFVVEAVVCLTGWAGLGTGLVVFAAFDVLVSVGVTLYALGPVLLRRGDPDELFEFRLDRRLRDILPAFAAMAVRSDVLALRAVVLQLLRRRPRALPGRGEADVTLLGYARGLLPTLLAVTFSDLVIVVLLTIVLPAGPLKLASHVLAAIGLAWIVAFTVSLVVYRHAVGHGAARLRFAGMYDALVEWHGSAEIVREERFWDGGKSGQIRGDALVFPVMNRTNVRVDLPAPGRTRSLNRGLDGVEVRKLYFSVDDESLLPRR